MEKIWLENIERAVIAIFLIDWNSIDLTELNINENLFCFPIYKTIFQVIVLLKEKWIAIDILTISKTLEDLGKLEYIWWSFALVEMTNWIFHLSNLHSYIKKLRGEFKRVEFMKITQKMSVLSKAWEILSDSIFQISNELLALSSQEEKNRMDDLIYEVQDTITQNKGKKIVWYSWGKWLEFLDHITSGIVKKRIYRVGAPSNVGKSQMIYSVINSLVQQKAKVAFFTLENSFSTTGINILSNKQGTNSRNIENGTFEADIDYLDKNRDNLFVIDDRYELSSILAKILELKPDVVVLDFVWLVNITWTQDDKHYTEYSRKVQQFMKRNNLAWIDLNNLSNEKQDDEVMRQRWEFYWSSFLKNTTDIWIHLAHYKPFYDFKKSFPDNSSEWMAMKNKQVITLMVTKNRFWTAKVEKIYMLDFDSGAKIFEANDNNIKLWWF